MTERTLLADLRPHPRNYEALGKTSAAFFSWVFVTDDDKALVQVNGDMAEEQARKYGEVLK